MATNGHSVNFAGGILGRQRHICAFFNSIDEEHRVLRSFIKDGFGQGEKAFHIVDPELWEQHLKRLAEAGINVHEAMNTGQLEVRPWQEDRKSTRLNSSHEWISYAVFCLKKKKTEQA